MIERERVARVVIHPALGVARVGSSDEFFYASEIPGRGPDPLVTSSCAVSSDRFKDEQGRMKRQAARFRLYALDEEGIVLGELTAEVGAITWTVHLANRKANWYNYVNPLDLEQRGLSVNKRNTPLFGVRPEDLVIDPGPMSIESSPGVLQKSEIMEAQFMNSETVRLGQLIVDEEGRLAVLGGWGKAGHPPPYNPVHHFANNDGWYDDISDGTVRASIVLPLENGDSLVLEAEPSMVVVTPPNYAPGLFQPTMISDIVEDVYLRHKGLAGPAELSFTKYIYPIFERLQSLQWTNEGIYMLFGEGSNAAPMAPENFARLASSAPEDREYRQRWFRWFRDPNTSDDDFQPTQIPPMYGDELRDFSGTARFDLSVTPTQYSRLQAWADGDFVDDWVGAPELPADLADIPLQEQPAALDWAHYGELLGGPFRPAVEVTWIFRVPSMWQAPECHPHAPFRLVILDGGTPVCDDYGPVLRPDVALASDGPCSFSGPGTLTRWMGVPWQADAGSCLGSYDPHYFLPLPALWPARIPTQVLSRDSYELMQFEGLSSRQRDKYFNFRSFYLRDLDNSSTQARLNDLVTEWDKLGVLRPRPQVAGMEELPEEFWVEEERSPFFSSHDVTRLQAEIADGSSSPDDARLQAAIEELPDSGFGRSWMRRLRDRMRR